MLLLIIHFLKLMNAYNQMLYRQAISISHSILIGAIDKVLLN